ncbi:hypothetical protein IPM62_05925 [Candidatus Woesebacteria bacterium]|nr:MAG: hypothetical protein IPM62_05925 [Candidatus Woesebacteria bacterium]
MTLNTLVSLFSNLVRVTLLSGYLASTAAAMSIVYREYKIRIQGKKRFDWLILIGLWALTALSWGYIYALLFKQIGFSVFSL